MGQRVQILTFSGSVYINTEWEIHSSTGVASLTKVKNQQLSGNVASDCLPVRDTEDLESNGYFEISSS